MHMRIHTRGASPLAAKGSAAALHRSLAVPEEVAPVLVSCQLVVPKYCAGGEEEANREGREEEQEEEEAPEAEEAEEMSENGEEGALRRSTPSKHRTEG